MPLAPAGPDSPGRPAASPFEERRMIWFRPALMCVLLAAGPAPAQDLGHKAPPQGRPVVINGARVHPVSGPVIERGHVAFDGGRITSVGAGDYPGDTRSAEIIEAAGLRVYPGLIGANTQTGLLEIGAVRATLDYSEAGSITPEVRAAVAVNPDSTIIPVTRANGILTVGVMPLGGAIPGRASVLSLEGWTWEDMALRDDAGIVVNWPNMRPLRAWWVTEPLEEQEKKRREALAAIDNAFRSARAYIDARAADPSLPTDLRWEAMRGVLERGDPVFIRADEMEQIQSAVAWAAGMGLRPVILGGRDAGAEVCIDLLKRHDAGVIVAGTFRLPRRIDTDYDEPFRLPAVLEEAGVRWCLASVGGPFETPHERNLPYHAALAAAYGLDPDAALRSITLSAALLLGVGDRLGSLEPGKDATLILTDGDPLEFTTEVRRAFISGKEIDLSNKQKALDEKYREKYRQIDGDR
jgi:imidazolonepropionase-like amidohydrolase